MDILTLGIAIVVMLFWGGGSFLAKLATNRIGDKAMFWDLIGYIPIMLVFCLTFFKAKTLAVSDKPGIWLALAAGALGSIAMVGFYYLLTRKDASVAVPITALYPALTAILAFIFLGEKITAVKSIAIILASAALVMLSL